MTPCRLADVERWLLRGGAFLLPLGCAWDTYDQYVLPKLLLARVLMIGLLILFISRTIITGTWAIRRYVLGRGLYFMSGIGGQLAGGCD
jgi:hypothetical protein